MQRDTAEDVAVSPDLVEGVTEKVDVSPKEVEPNEDDAYTALLALTKDTPKSAPLNPLKNPFNSSMLQPNTTPLDDTPLLPPGKIAGIMRKALPPGSFVSKDAKEAMQKCASEFIAFLSAMAGDSPSATSTGVVRSTDIVFALMNGGFENFSRFCHIFLTKNYATLDGITNRNRTDQSHALNVANDMLSQLPKDNLPDIHCYKSLREASLDVARSLVFARSHPLVASALTFAGTPTSIMSTSSHDHVPPSPVNLPLNLSQERITMKRERHFVRGAMNEDEPVSKKMKNALDDLAAWAVATSPKLQPVIPPQL